MPAIHWWQFLVISQWLDRSKWSSWRFWTWSLWQLHQLFLYLWRQVWVCFWTSAAYQDWNLAFNSSFTQSGLFTTMSMGCNLSVQLAGIWAETTRCFLRSDVMSDVVCPWKQSNRTRAGCEVSKSSVSLFLAKKGTMIISMYVAFHCLLIVPMVVSVPDVPACWYRYRGGHLLVFLSCSGRYSLVNDTASTAVMYHF